MISDKEIQNSYIDLYRQVRKYFWDYDTIEVIANLEIESFKKFPNKNKLLSLFNELKLSVSKVIRDDEDFKKALDDFQSVIEQSDWYSRLKRFKEVSL